MITELARARARGLLNSLAQGLAVLGISPDALTVAGFVGMCAISLVIAAGYEPAGGILMIVAGVFDALDGTLARLSGRVTKFGAFLDSTLDRWAESVLFLGIVFRSVTLHDDVAVYLAVTALIGSLLVSYTRARAEGLGATIKGGWFTRFERMIVLVAGLVLTGLFGRIALNIALAILAVFANLTAAQRILAARQALK